MTFRRVLLSLFVFCCLAPVFAKDYADPDGAFAVRVPDNWQTQRAPIDTGVWLTVLAPLVRPGQQSESLNIVAVPTPKAATGAALDNLAKLLIGVMEQILKTQGTVQIGETTHVKHENLDAVRADLSFTSPNGTDRGYFLVLSGQRHAFLVVPSGPQGDENGLKRAEAVLSTLVLEGTQPKAGIAMPPATQNQTGAADVEATNQAAGEKFVKDLVEEEKELIAMQQAFLERTPDKEAKAPDNNTLRARFTEANAARLAAPENSKERALSARRAMDAATDMAWLLFDKQQFDEAATWFEKRAALRRESYQAARTFQENLVAQRFDDMKKWRALQKQSAPDQAAGFHAVLTLIGGLQAERLQVLQTFATDSNDNAAVVRYATQELQLRTDELQDATQKGALLEPIEGKKAQIAAAHEHLATALSSLARYDEAEKNLRRALEIRRGLPATFGQRDIHIPIAELGALRGALGDLPGARDFYQQALLALESDAPARAKTVATELVTPEGLKIEATIAQGTILLTLATVLENMNDYVAAARHLERIPQLLETVPETGDLARRKQLLGLTARLMLAATHADAGETTTALSEIKEITPLLRTLSGEIGVSGPLVSTLAVYAVLYERGEISRAQILEARTYAEQFQRVAVSTQDLGNMARASYFLATIDNELDDLPNASLNAEEFLNAARKAENTSDISDAQVMLAKVRHKQKREDEALAALAEADKFAAGVGSSLDKSMISDVRGQVLEAKGDLPGASASYKQAIALMESVRAGAASESDFSSLKSRYEVYEHMVRLLIKMGRADEAFDYLGRAKSKKMQDNLRLTNVRSPNPELQALLDRFNGIETKLQTVSTQLQSEQSKPETERDAAKIETLKTLVATTQGEYRRVFEEIKTKHPNWEANLTVKPRELKATQRSIPAGVVLVQYAPVGEQIYIFVVTRDDLKIYTPAAKTEDVFTRIKNLRRLIVQEGQRGVPVPAKAPATNDSSSSTGNLLALYEMLIKPIEADIKDAKTIAFIPNQILYYLPFHALARRDGDKVRYLIEDKEVVYLTGADVMRFVQPSDTTKKQNGLVAFGNPTGANLPASQEEVKTIGTVYPQSQIMTGADVTKGAVTASTTMDKRIVHFATHGFLNANVPSQSYIQLAKGGAQGSEQLTVNEVWDLPLQKVDLVTLSACETALSQRNPDGGDITTLAEAFSTAGATSVLCSLWSVADDSTRDLMVEFYTQLAAGATKGAALRAAELKVMRNPQTAHPFYWSPFILMGDWR